MDGFCKGELLDIDSLWGKNATVPHFTECALHTVLVWIPVLWLLLLAPYQVYIFWTKHGSPLPWKCLLIRKLVLILLATVVTAVAFISAAIGNSTVAHDVSPVDVMAYFLLFMSSAMLASFTVGCQKRGRVTSPVISLSLLVFVIFGIVEFAVRVKEIVEGEMEKKSVYSAIMMICYLLYYVIFVLLLICHCVADRSADYETAEKVKRSPEYQVSFFSRILFTWMDGLCLTGWRRPLTTDDLWALSDKDTAGNLVKKWETNWSARIKEYQRLKSEYDVNQRESANRKTEILKAPAYPSVVYCLFQCVKGIFIPGTIIKTISDILQFLSPLILSLLLQFVSNKDEPTWKGYFYAVLLFLVALLVSTSLNWYWHGVFRMGMHVKTMLTSAIFNKALNLSNSARRRYPAGEIVNLLTVDVQRFMDVILYMNFLFSTPLTVGLCMYFIYQQIGVSMFAGLGFMILLIPFNIWVLLKQRDLQFEQMKLKDNRIKIVNEIITGMKVLKLYAWEESFEKRVTETRAQELAVLRKSAYYSSCSAFSWTCAPVMVAVVSFACYVLVDPVNHVLTPERAFVSLALFNILKAPLILLPMVAALLAQVAVSNKRVKELLVAEELDPSMVTRNANQEEAVMIEKGMFAWDKESGKADLDNINIRIKPGQLVAVVGQVGSGKSSLMHAILGEMEKLEGFVGTKGRIAYVPQQAWIQNMPLRENITFSKSYSKEKYEQVIEACTLKTDFEMFPAGDRTEIGEKGINVSGGQKQRISLARAVYNDADLYLLDDPLSAVDAHVGKHIFQHVISHEGLLKEKTRILVTHGLSYMKHVDQIIVLREGKIHEMGTYKQLLSHGGVFADLIENYLEQKVKEATDDASLLEEVLGDDADVETLERLGSVIMRKVSQDNAPASDAPQSRDFIRLISQLSTGTQADADVINAFKAEARKSLLMSTAKKNKGENKKANKKEKRSDEDASKLIQDEQAETGKVKWAVYKNYLMSMGWWISVGVLVLYMISNAFAVGSSVWLSEWSDDSLRNDTIPPNERIGVYASLGLAQALFTLAAALLMAYGMVRAGAYLHRRLLHNLLRSPMSFYDVTPVGRIVNRAGKDMDVIDNRLPEDLRTWILNLMNLVATLIIMIIGLPIFGVVLIPLGLLYYLLLRFYINTLRQLKRLEAISRSPLISHFQESAAGSVLIRAYNVQDGFVGELQRRVDQNNRCYWPSTACGRWLGIRLDLIGNLIVLATALFAVISKQWDTSGATAGATGLAVSYAMSITMQLYITVYMTSEVESNIVAVERVKEYCETPTEAEWHTDQKPSADWPESGRVNFDRYKLRYRPGLDLVLRGISTRVNGGERIGIVGRTGAGKSSLTLALFRIIEADDGKILIDGQDISKIGLHDLRSRLTIIPQDPVLFSGTLRFNLDPFDRHSDEKIWTVLEQAHLKTFVTQTPTKLAYEIAEGGENLSVGQRQLICLARALLRKTKILVLDEATAAVDLETDDLIQKTIRSCFSDCTTLTIAHRLNTIMDSDRVLVLSKGEIAEFDSPQRLLEDNGTVFYSMAKESGLV